MNIILASALQGNVAFPYKAIRRADRSKNKEWRSKPSKESGILADLAIAVAKVHWDR